MKLPLTASFEESANKDANLGRIVNMYAEADKFSPGKLVFYPTPGFRQWKQGDDGATVQGTGIYDAHTYNGSLYCITDSEFIAVTQSGAVSNVSASYTITGTWTDVKDIDMADNYVGAGSDILMVNGSEAYAWISTTNYVRIDLVDSGTTTAGVGGTIMTDSGASFTSDDDVRVGTKIVNTTTGSEAYITAVAATTITCDASIWSAGGGETYEIGNSNFPKATSVEYLDGYFLANNLGDTQNKGRFYWGEQFEVRGWAATDFASAETNSDDLLCIKAVGRNAYLIGSGTTEVRFNAGTATNPWKLRHVLPIGTGHAKSVERYGDTLFMVGKVGKTEGSEITVGLPAKGNQVLAVTGASYEVISNPKLDRILNDHRVIDGDTIMYGSIYELNGHAFYRLYISDAINNDNQITSRTFVFNINEGTWHEEQYPYNTGVSQRGGPFFKVVSLLTTYSNGSGNQHTSGVLGISTDTLWIHEIAPESMGHVGDTAGITPVTVFGITQNPTRELISVPIHDENDNDLLHKKVTLRVTTGHKAAALQGVATATSSGKLICDYCHFNDDGVVDNTMTVHNITDGTSATITTVDNNRQLTLGTDIMAAGDLWTIDTGTDPDITLEWTDDGGDTWKGPLTVTLGAAGDDPTKVIFNNLGISKNRSYRIKCSGFAYLSISDAYVDVDVYEDH